MSLALFFWLEWLAQSFPSILPCTVHSCFSSYHEAPKQKSKLSEEIGKVGTRWMRLRRLRRLRRGEGQKVSCFFRPLEGRTPQGIPTPALAAHNWRTHNLLTGNAPLSDRGTCWPLWHMYQLKLGSNKDVDMSEELSDEHLQHNMYIYISLCILGWKSWNCFSDLTL